MMRKARPMQNAQLRLARTLMWIGLGGGVVLLPGAVFSKEAHWYAMSLHLILSSTSILVRPRRPRLANVCAALGVVAAIAYVVLFMMWITR